MSKDTYNGDTIGADVTIERGGIALDAASGVARPVRAINAQTGTAYTPVLADVGKLVTLDNESAITLTFAQDDDETDAIPVGAEVSFLQTNTGLATAAAGSGATVTKDAFFTLAFGGQHALVRAVKVAADTWNLSGGLEAA